MKVLYKAIFLSWMLWLGAGAQMSEATPPSEIQLQYDRDRKVLAIQVAHVTRDLTEHFIRKILVYKNEEAPLSYFFTRQPSADELKTEVHLELKAGDTARVKAVCSKAGFKEETLLIIKE